MFESPKFLTNNIQHQVFIVQYINFKKMCFHLYCNTEKRQRKKSKNVKENQLKRQKHTHKILESMFMMAAVNPAVDHI